MFEGIYMCIDDSDEYRFSRAIYKDYILKYFDKKYRILDVGCGRGLYVSYYVSKGFNVEGCDINRQVIEQNKMQYHQLRFFSCDLESQPLDTKYNLIYSFDVIEHVFDFIKFLQHIYHSLENGGIAIIGTPNSLGILSRLKLLLGDISIITHPKNAGGHIRFFTPKSLADAMAYCGFEIVEIAGVSYKLPLPKSLASYALVVGKKRV